MPSGFCFTEVKFDIGAKFSQEFALEWQLCRGNYYDGPLQIAHKSVCQLVHLVFEMNKSEYKIISYYMGLSHKIANFHFGEPF